MLNFFKNKKDKEEDIVTSTLTPPTAEYEDEIENTPIENIDDESLPAEPVKKGFFSKLSEGLQKTRASLNDKIDSVITLSILSLSDARVF